MDPQPELHQLEMETRFIINKRENIFDYNNQKLYWTSATTSMESIT